MSADQQLLPIWVVKWKMPGGGRGRKHTAIFIPNAVSASDHPVDAAKSEGTLFQVSGSPFGGFALNIKRNWNNAEPSVLESAFAVARIEQRHVWIPEGTEYIPDDTRRRADTDRFAHNVRPPGVTSRPWIAEEVMDCQDWVISFVEHMVQRRVIAEEALQATRDAMDPKTALMPAPSEPRTRLGQPNAASETPATPPLTASILRSPFPMSQQRANPSPQPSTQPRVGQSEWKAERSRFERYNHATTKWEYLNTTPREWVERL